MKKLTATLVVLTLLVIIPKTGFAKNANDWYERGVEFYKSRDFNKAIDAFTKTIELDPEYARAYHDRALIQAALGKHQPALNDYNRAIELNPEYAKAYYNRAVLYMGIGKEEKAISDLKAAARLDLKPAQDYLKQRGIQW